MFLRLCSESLLYSPRTSRARKSESSDPTDAATDVKQARVVIELRRFDVKTSSPAPTPGSKYSLGKADSAGGQLRNAEVELDEGGPTCVSQPNRNHFSTTPRTDTTSSFRRVDAC